LCRRCTRGDGTLAGLACLRNPYARKGGVIKSTRVAVTVLKSVCYVRW
jgi:hypothetical protein